MQGFSMIVCCIYHSILYCIVQVIPVFSRVGYADRGTTSSGSVSVDSDSDSEGVRVRVGQYVQEALRQDSVRTPRNTAALLCGMR